MNVRRSVKIVLIVVVGVIYCAFINTISHCFAEEERDFWRFALAFFIIPNCLFCLVCFCQFLVKLVKRMYQAISIFHSFYAAYVIATKGVDANQRMINQRIVAICYLNGWGVKSNYARAMKWFLKLALTNKSYVAKHWETVVNELWHKYDDECDHEKTSKEWLFQMLIEIQTWLCMANALEIDGAEHKLRSTRLRAQLREHKNHIINSSSPFFGSEWNFLWYCNLIDRDPTIDIG